MASKLSGLFSQLATMLVTYSPEREILLFNNSVLLFRSEMCRSAEELAL